MSGFPTYTSKQLRKVNAIRRAITQPDIWVVPTLLKGQVLFVTSAAMNDEPASCTNCIFYNYGKTCQLIGPHVKVRKFIYPKSPMGDSKPIEYWPCCSMHEHGEPNRGGEKFLATDDPTNLGLLWVNAPRVGQERGGANCGGQAGGDDCDNYMTEGDDKRAAASGFCRVLQATVQNGDVCAAWDDDDKIDWTKAQTLIDELEED